MKKSYFTLVVLCVPALLFAQNTKRRLCDLIQPARPQVQAAASLKSANPSIAADSCITYYFNHYNDQGQEVIDSTRSWKNIRRFDNNNYQTLNEAYEWVEPAGGGTGSREWRGSHKYEQTYDSRGRTTERVHYYWDDTSKAFVPSSKDVDNYDDGYALEISTGYYYLWENNAWVLEEKRMPIFEQTKLTGIKIYARKNGAMVLVGEYKDGTYDAQGRITSFKGYSTPEEGGAMELDEKMELEYYPDGKLKEERQYILGSSGQWVKELRINYAYDERKVSTVLSDNNAGQWLNSEKFIRDYDAYNNQILNEYYSLSQSDFITWVREYKEITEYNSRRQETRGVSYTGQSADAINSTWVGSSNREYTYDAQGNMSEEKDYVWNSHTEEWDAEPSLTKIENTYKEGKLMCAERQEDYGSGWETVGKDFYYYSEATGVQATESNTARHLLLVYPNPAEQYVYFKPLQTLNNPRFKLYNTVGEEVINKFIANKKSISVQHLPNGVYIYVITDKGQTQSGKLIKKQ